MPLSRFPVPVGRSLDICLRILALLALLGALPAQAAQVVHVDPTGNCAMNFPCFSTIQQAINNAEPPAEVRIFPGTYEESVDLSLMGSLVGSEPGTITLLAVNALNEPSSGTATIVGNSGSDTGTIFDSEGTTGTVTLRGLRLAPDPIADRFVLSLDNRYGGLTLEGLTFVDLDNDTLPIDVLLSTGSLRIIDVALDGAGAGNPEPINARLSGPGDLIIRNLVATEFFSGPGFSLGNQGEVRIEGCRLSGMGSGAGFRLTLHNGAGSFSFDGSVTIDDMELRDINNTDFAIAGTGGPSVESIEVSNFRFVDSESRLRISMSGPDEAEFRLGLLSITDLDLGDRPSTGLSLSFLGGADRVLLDRISALGDESSFISAGDDSFEYSIHELTISNSAFSTRGGTALLIRDLLTTGTHVIEKCYFNAQSQSDTVLQLSASTTLTAINNWWGGTEGPNHPTNPDSELGDVRDGENLGRGKIVFAPWLDTITTMAQANPMRTGQPNLIGFQITNTTGDAFLPEDLGATGAAPLFRLATKPGIFVDSAGEELDNIIPASIEGTTGTISARLLTENETTVNIGLSDEYRELAVMSLQSLGIPELTAFPPMLDFGPQDIDDGPVGPLAVLVVNIGTTTLTLTGDPVITGPHAGDFQVVGFDLPTFPTEPGAPQLAGGPAGTVFPIRAEAQFHVVFNPTAVGARTARLEFPSDDPDSPLLVPLMGSGNDEGISTRVVYADGSGNCNGDGPCYPTIQEAVNHAGPAPAIVYIYPGVYDEHVNLGLMGSAIGGERGAIDLITVDANGVPTSGTAILTNESDLIPPEPTLQTAGFGPLIYNDDPVNIQSILPNPPVDDVRIDGLILRAFSTEGIDLQLYRGLTVENADIQSTSRDALGVAMQNGNLTIRRTKFDSSSNAIAATTVLGGDLVIEDVETTRSYQGLLYEGHGNVSIDGFTAYSLGFAGGMGIDLRNPLTPSFDIDLQGPGGPVSRTTTTHRIDIRNVDIKVQQGNTPPEPKLASIAGQATYLSVDSPGSEMDLALRDVSLSGGDGFVIAIAANGVTAESILFDGVRVDNSKSFLTTGRLSQFQLNNCAVSTMTIRNSSFIGGEFTESSGHDVILFSDGGSTHGIENVLVDRSTFLNTGRGLYFYGGDSLVRNMAIQSSYIQTFFGTRFGPVFSTTGTYTIGGSTFCDAGIEIERGVDLAIDASYNYWGHPSGPIHPDNPSGNGVELYDEATGTSGTIQYTPFMDRYLVIGSGLVYWQKPYDFSVILEATDGTKMPVGPGDPLGPGPFIVRPGNGLIQQRDGSFDKFGDFFMDEPGTFSTTWIPDEPGTTSIALGDRCDDVTFIRRIVQPRPIIEVVQVSLDFGGIDVDDGPAPTQQVIVTNRGISDLEISNLRIEGPGAAAYELGGAPSDFAVFPNTSETLTVTFDPTTSGTRDATLIIESNDIDAPRLEVALTGEGLDQRIVVEPLSLNWGTVRTGFDSDNEMRVTIRNPGTATLRLTGFGIQGAAASSFEITNFPVDMMVEPGGDRSVSIKFLPLTDGPKSALLLISSDDSMTPAIAVTLEGTAATPRLTLNPLTLSFGGHPINLGPTSPTQFVTYSNDSGTTIQFTGDLRFEGFGADGYFLVTTPTTGTMSPGESRQLGLVFDPSVHDEYPAELIFPTDDPNFPSLPLYLFGVGTPPVGPTGLTTQQLVDELLGESRAVPPWTLDQLDVNEDGVFDIADVTANVNATTEP